MFVERCWDLRRSACTTASHRHRLAGASPWPLRWLLSDGMTDGEACLQPHCRLAGWHVLGPITCRGLQAQDRVLAHAARRTPCPGPCKCQPDHMQRRPSERLLRRRPRQSRPETCEEDVRGEVEVERVVWGPATPHSQHNATKTRYPGDTHEKPRPRRKGCRAQ